ncbi:glucose 1-dehydrogenase [Candidatus Entotheonella palauensis]|uniref:glucose 1-dehydrogenase n=1 Tax=Candidatus Entotheonella palauensis TaxID=93172 RepID=UPI000B7E202D|nr:glucose 1-dehydrogenase [Candidatus Entotheonella palauensis]
MRLQNKIAVITGAASGFGKATAIRFAREGARVVLVDLNESGAQAVAADIRRADGEAIAVGGDVTQLADCRRMVQEAVANYGQLDVLFNNAGVPMAPTPIEEVSDGLWEKLWSVNVTGVLHGCQAAIPQMKEQGHGVIINTASTSGVRPRPGLVAYAASKGAVITFTKGLALELAPAKIRVNAISPVAADTPMLPGFMSSDADFESARQAFIATVPLGRLTQADDVAHAALYLASDEAAHITGINLEVDGGRDI